MNTNINAEMLSINTKIPLMGCLLIITLYVIALVYIIKYAKKESEKYKYASLENVAFMKIFFP